VVFAAAFFAYSNSLKNGFCWDDHILIENNAFLADPSALKILAEQMMLKPVIPLISAARPVFVATLVLDHRLWANNPFGYHATNIALHGLNAVLVWRAGLIFLQPDAALLAGLVFAVHPVNTEAVNLASFRPDLLASFFMLLALLAYREMEESSKPARAGIALAASALAYALGSFSKETALVFPAAALWFDFCFLKKPWREKFWRRAAAMAVFCGLALYYWHFRSHRSGYNSIAPQAAASAPSTPSKTPPAQTSTAIHEEVFNPSAPQWDAIYHSSALNFRSMCAVFADYFRLMAFPYPLHVDRVPPLIFSWSSRRLWAALALFALLFAAGLWAYLSDARPFCWGLGWCVIALMPASDIVHLYNPMAERYLYPAAIGICWVFGWAASLGLSRISRQGRPLRRFAAVFGAGAALLLLSTLTRARNRDWKSDAVLFGREAALGTKNARVYYNLGFMKQIQGDLRQAEQDYKTALALNPHYIEALNNLASFQEMQGHPQKALRLYSKAISFKPGNSIPYDGLGEALERQNDIVGAIAAYRKALQETPNDVPARINLAALFEKTGRSDLAENELRDAVRRSPQNFHARFDLASLLDKIGRHHEAARVWLSFLAVVPRDARAMMNLGVEYDHAAQCPQALAWLRRSIAANPNDAAASYNLGMAQEHCGLSADAAQSLRKALALDSGYSDAAYNLAVIEQQAGHIDKAIALYKKTLALDPGKIEALNNLGGIYQMRGDLKQAEKYLALALSLFPRHPSLLNNMGNVYLQEGNLPEAIASYRAAIGSSSSLDKNLAPTWTNLGICYYRQGRLSEAEKTWERAIADFPDYRSAYQWLAQAYHESGRDADAAALMRQMNALSNAAPAAP